MRKKAHENGLSPADFERAAGALRVLNAHAAFGISLLRGEQPQRPSLEERRAKRARYRSNVRAREAHAKAQATV